MSNLIVGYTYVYTIKSLPLIIYKGYAQQICTDVDASAASCFYEFVSFCYYFHFKAENGQYPLSEQNIKCLHFIYKV